MDQVQLLHTQFAASALKYQQDISQRDLQLAHERQLNADLQNQILQLTNANQSASIQLQAKLSASQLRCEQLHEQLTDLKTQNYQLQSNYVTLQKQLDQAKDQYFQLQRQLQVQREDGIIQQQRQLQKFNEQEQKIETLKSALKGAISISKERNMYADTVDQLLQQDCSKEALLGKIACLSNENMQLARRQEDSAQQLDRLSQQLDRYQALFSNCQVPSVKVLMQQLEEAQAQLSGRSKQCSELKGEINDLLLKQQRLQSDNSGLRQALAQTRQNMQQMGELRKIVQEMIAEDRMM